MSALRSIAQCGVLLAVLLLAASTCMAANPFTGGGGGGADTEKSEAVAAPGAQASSAPVLALPEPLAELIAKLVPLQRQLRNELTRTVRTLQETRSPRGFFLFLLLSFSYGVLHAAGPGHGKAVAGAYFLARGGTVFQGLFLGFNIGVMHALSATLVVGVIHLVLQVSVMPHLDAAAEVITRISFGLITALGIGMAVMVLWKLVSLRGAPPPPRPVADGDAPAADRNLFLMASVAGLVPCPGAAIILLFTIALDATLLGLASVCAMAAGMGTTISAAAVVTVLSREKVLSAAGRSPGLYAVLHALLSLLGALAVTALGGLMFMASLGG